MVNLYEGFSKRLNIYLDRFDIPVGRKRAGALAKRLGVTSFTSRSMLNNDKPPKDETLVNLISILEPDAELKQTLCFLKFGSDIISKTSCPSEIEMQIIFRVVQEVKKQSLQFGLNLDDIPVKVIENIWIKLFNHANQNNGVVDSKEVRRFIEYLQELFVT